jgi:hypothetical protein
VILVKKLYEENTPVYSITFLRLTSAEMMGSPFTISNNGIPPDDGVDRLHKPSRCGWRHRGAFPT